MILSVSRRTDIPALYSEWFMNRLRAGKVLVRNPMNFKQITSVPLSPQNVDCIVFWTKDPGNLCKHLNEIDRMGYTYYFTISINPYDKTIERNVGDKKGILKSVKNLSERIGRERVIWRYDPILFSESIDTAYHIKWFKNVSRELEQYTDKCVISFLDEYKKIKKNLNDLHIVNPDFKIISSIAQGFSEIANKYSMKLATCSHDFNFTQFCIDRNKCIDDDLIEKLIGRKIQSKKDPFQRKDCGCIESKDIGAYNTCIHDCQYCYANSNKALSYKNHKNHDLLSPLLGDKLRGDETITLYKRHRSLVIDDK